MVEICIFDDRCLRHVGFTIRLHRIPMFIHEPFTIQWTMDPLKDRVAGNVTPVCHDLQVKWDAWHLQAFPANPASARQSTWSNYMLEHAWFLIVDFDQHLPSTIKDVPPCISLTSCTTFMRYFHMFPLAKERSQRPLLRIVNRSSIYFSTAKVKY